MSEENFWTIGFRKTRHKKSQQIWVFIDNYLEYKPLKSLKDKDMARLVRYSTIEEANKILDAVRRRLIELGKQSNFDSAQFTPLQINVKNVKSNTEG